MNKSPVTTIDSNTRALRAALEGDMQKYLANGGKVTKCPPLQFSEHRQVKFNKTIGK